ncbi:NAD(P)/FAD-dependent oxidoreductase [Dyella sp. C9]|uniref:phytoene desaturase family protein n=1 Tax=Dyella sp. C9 TaxID=2202154 RepID=UPI000DEFEDDE|nr:NAD(P)/FAD-dependent oxidoreductase [Dyella sp. C9]
MDKTYDIIALGGGHNGLTTAAYLAKAGKKVLVLERKSWAGGGVVTRELTVPGYKHDEHSNVHIMIQGNPLITRDELGLLGKFGLKYNYSKVPHGTIFEDNSTMCTYASIDRTCDEIAQYSQKDADTYRRFAEQSIKFLPMLLSGMYAPPPPVGPFLTMLDQTPEGRMIGAAMHRSTLDMVNELYENDKVKIHFMKLLTENLQMPDELGTGLGLYVWPGLIHSVPPGMPIGGSGKLTEATVRCIEHHGGEVRLNCEVTKVLTRGGRAVGVQTADGQEILAKDAVIAALHPRVLGRYVEGLDDELLLRASRVKPSSFSLLLGHYALNERTRYKAGAHISEATLLEYVQTSKLDEFLADFDPIRHGRLPQNLLLSGGDMSHADPTRVPDGKGIFYSVCFAPYRLAEGPQHWDRIKEEMEDKVLGQMSRYISNLDASNIVARKVYSPLDMERSSPNSFVDGDIHGAAPLFYQTGGYRPLQELAQYRVPKIDGLYLVGPFMHPGGGVFGGGRATAINMFSDLGMDFDKLIGTESSMVTTRTTTSGDNPRMPPREQAAPATATLFGPGDEDLMTIRSVAREGDELVVKGQAFGAMPLVAKLRPEEARRIFKLLNLRTLWFLLSMLFRRSKTP